MRGYVVGPGRAISGEDPGLKASAAPTGGALTLIESDTTGGAPHVHGRQDEGMYVVERSITATCGRRS